MKRVLLVFALCALATRVASLDGDTFTISCAPLTIQRSDPILSPGIASGHTHSVVGGNAFRRSMPGMFDANNASSTTCDKALDHSNYWVPSLYHQRTDKTFELVPWSGSAIYYQKRACNYKAGQTTCNTTAQMPLAFPYGFRMIAGDSLRRTQDSTDFAQKAIDIVCLGPGGEQPGFPKQRCDRMRAQVYFPSCWDGVNLDSDTHKSHVAYPAIGDFNGGVCPSSHPVAIFSIFFEFFFETAAITDFNRFVFANGDTTGYGFHGDFIMGWTDRTLLQNAHAACINSATCPTLGTQNAMSRPLITPAIYEEPVGLDGPVPVLPGKNPVDFTN